MELKTALKFALNLSGGERQPSVLPFYLCAAMSLCPPSATAQMRLDNGPASPRETPHEIKMTLNLSSSRGKTIHLSAPAASIFVADPAILDFQAPSNTTIFVFGKKAGRTRLFALNDQGEALAELRVVVTQPIEDLRAMLKARVGAYPIQVSYTPRGAILSGTAPSADIVDTAMRITEQFRWASRRHANCSVGWSRSTLIS